MAAIFLVLQKPLLYDAVARLNNGVDFLQPNRKYK
jgi:hypothetical protein